jgi:ATP-dependent helicase HrpB
MDRSLPIFEIESAVRTQTAKYRRAIVEAPTGSGKSTQVPQMLLEGGLLGNGAAVILQPRRLAARLLAARVAQERGVRLGDEVGYQIRFENRSGPATRIKYVTEGILLRQMLADPALPGVSAILFDEFHERHLYGDITLARALQLQESSRPDLQILVMSATLAAEPLWRYLEPCAILRSEGRMHPVSVSYLDRASEDAPWDLAARACEDARTSGRDGDILVFMPGAYEIARTIDALRVSSAGRGAILLPLHGELPTAEQDAAVARYDRHKIVVATNVAETSLTIDGIRVVVDCGLARIERYDPYRGINTLLVEKISRASADQRTGRAGRTAPGHCYRLWTEADHRGRPLQELPEVRRLDLAEVVLTLKASGIDDVRGFRWLEPPEARSLERAETLLEDLGAIDHRRAITPLGRRMLSFPVHPRYARMLVAAGDLGCVNQAALIAALVQGRNLLARRQDKHVEERRDDLFGGEVASDFFLLARAWSYAQRSGFSGEAGRRTGINLQAARQVGPLYEHFVRIAREEGLPVDRPPADDEAVQKCVLTGFVDHLARRLDAGTLRCEMVHGRRGVLARESAVQKSPLLVAAEVREIEGRAGDLNVLLSLATEVKAEWLRELFPEDFSTAEEAVYDEAGRRVYGERRELFRDLVLESKRNDSPPADAAAELLAMEVVKGRLVLKNWDAEVEQWIVRVNCLAGWCPDLGLPAISGEDRAHLMAQVCHGAVSYKEIKDRDVWPVVKGWLNAAQTTLIDRYAPARIELPGGRRAKVTYAPDAPPYVAARIQDLYGLTETPRIAMGRIPLLCHILAPSQRPVQITQDLAGFWREHYPRVKQELQRKYPKHEWR